MKRQSKLRPLSKKRASEKRDYAEACKEYDQKMLDEFGHLFCVSCGCNNPDGGHSHNMPVAHYKELESDPRNFALRCFTCHCALDYPDFSKIIKFLDFQTLIDYRREKDTRAYNQWVSALIAIGITGYPYIE